MSKRKQEEVTQEISSEETVEAKETETPAPKKQKEEKLPDGGVVSLGSNKFVTVTEFRGKVYVGIREYYEKDGELKPGKKGIALSLEQWNLLKDVFFSFSFLCYYYYCCCLISPFLVN